MTETLDQELEPYFKDGKWRIPYLMDGAGGFGGGVGEFSHETKQGVICLYREHGSDDAPQPARTMASGSQWESHCREVARVILAGFNHKERDNETWRDEIAKILQREFTAHAADDKIFRSMSVSVKGADGTWSEPERL